jgi:hypothetical protein
MKEERVLRNADSNGEERMKFATPKNLSDGKNRAQSTTGITAPGYRSALD